MSQTATQDASRDLVGKRIEIPVHFDLWMQGARFGTVSSADRKTGAVKVKMDHPQVRNRVTIQPADIDFCRFP